MNPDHPGARIFTVSELTAEIKSLLETRYPFVWVQGEVSNLRIPSSGHGYFTLKDNQSQIQAVVFKNQMRGLGFDLEDGLTVKGLGRISVYAPRGVYQMVFEYLEPRGTGALQKAFEQLKNRLSKEGLFDREHKKAIPFLPRQIAVVTSPSGSVIQDILNISSRRFPGIRLQITSVKVQGEGADHEIAEAISHLNKEIKADVIILARGGGSLEDLAAFNTEIVARAIYASRIPVVSAIGHETDFTISDFVADLRAPTPSAAAEVVIPKKSDLLNRIKANEDSLIIHYKACLSRLLSRLREVSGKLQDPKRAVIDARLHLDELIQRLMGSTVRTMMDRSRNLHFLKRILYSNNPIGYITKYKEVLENDNQRCRNAMGRILAREKDNLNRLHDKLLILNPIAILDLGYSITRLLDGGAFVRDSSRVSVGQEVSVKLAKGELLCQIKRTIPHE